MKRVLLFVFIIVIAVMSACGVDEPESVETPSPTPTVSHTLAPTPASTAAPATPTPKPGPVSYTTGLPYDGEYKPVIVVIENSPAARPQTGLQTADVVYEVPVEGSITRFVCVFSDNVPEEVMPVRSCRVPFLYIQHEWDAVFMHCGGSGKKSSEYKQPYSVYGHSLYRNMKYHIDETKGKWGKYFDRVKKGDHGVMGYPKLAQQLYDYDPKPLNWIFDSDISYFGESVHEIKLKMCSNKKDYVSYTYNPGKDIYMRFMRGKAFKSKETDAQVSVKNIIVQYSTYKSSKKVKLWKLVGSGKADFYIGGKLIKGTWKRETEDDETIFSDDKGNQIVLRPGNTWIHISTEK